MNKPLVLFQNNQYEKESSNAMNISFLSVLIGASELQILEAAGHFDFSAKKLTNLADPTAAQDAATKAYVDAQVGGSGDFSDSAFRISDNGDSTKKIAFEASGITTGTVRTVTMPDADVNLGHIANLVTLSGVAAGEPDLGAFSGGIIPDDSTIKAALQSLETEIENLPTPMVYRGVYNATTNSPALADGVGSTGDLYRVSVAGTQDFGSGNITFEVGDMVVYNGATWEKWDVIDAVISVNGASGVVTVNAINQLTGEATTSAASGSQSLAVTLSNAAVIGKLLTGFVSGAGTVAATDSILQAIQKLDGNDGLKANQALDNLASTAVNADILPSGDNLRDLGSASLRFAEVHAEVLRSGRMGDHRASFTFSADTTNASAVIAVASTAGFKLYDDVSGPGIPLDSYIVNIVANTSITISAPATATATGVTLTYKYNTMLLTGDVSGSATSGAVGLQTGKTDSGMSGPVFLFSGESANGDSGNVYIGTGAAPNGNAGLVFLFGSTISLNGEVTANNNRLQDVADPTQPQDAVTQAYGDANYLNTASSGIKLSGVDIQRDDAKSFTNDNAGAITVRQVVYIKSNGAVDLANNATIGLGTKMIGLVEDASIAAAASGKVAVRRGAIVPGFSGLTPGAPVYIGATLGATTQTAPTASGTAVFQLGMALSATEVEFNPMFLISNV